MTTATVTDTIISITNNGNLSLDHVSAMLSTQHDEQIVLDLVRKLCLHSTNHDMMKKGMEYLFMNGFYEDLQHLIDKNKKLPNKSNNKWAVIYQLMLDLKLKKFSPLEKLNRVTYLQSEEVELKWLIEFLKTSVHHGMKDFRKIGDFLDKQQQLFRSIQDPFLISSFNLRLYQLLFYYHWGRNELIIARKYAFRALNVTKNPSIKASLNMCLGLTYTFDTYQQGMYHMEEARRISMEHGLVNNIRLIENHNIPFLSAHHKKINGISTNDKSEQAHIEIAMGNMEKAEIILKELPLDTPFQLYYLGLATKDKDILHQSYNYFIEKRSDYFFSKLPILALQDMGA